MDGDVASSSSSSSDAESTWSDLDEPSASRPSNGTTSAAARPTHGQKLPFQPKAGYVPAAFSPDVLSIFAQDAFAHGSRKELWCVKIPEGVKPSDVDGIKITVPDKAQPDARLAHMHLKRAAKSEELRAYKQSFSFRARRNAASGGSSAKDEDDDDDARTQLIEMADGNKVLDAEASKGGSDGNVEMEVLHVMLPDPKRRGGYKFAPVPISQYAQLLLEAPVKTDMTGDKTARKRTAHELSADGQAANASAGSSAPIFGQREQPWDKLKGFFHPAGARSHDDEEGVPSPHSENAISASHDKSDVQASPIKKSKKSSKKHDKGDASTSTSTSKDKEQKKKKKKEKTEKKEKRKSS